MSCSDVCVNMDVDGSSEFCLIRTQRAAKPHRCCECGREIAKGEQYEIANGKYDGDFYTAKSCAECAEIRNAFCCGSWLYGELWEEIRDQLFPKWDAMKAIDCLAKLTTDAAIAKMRGEYDQFREDAA